MNIQSSIDRKGLVLSTALLAVVIVAPFGCDKSTTPQEWFVASKNLLPPDAQLVAGGTGTLSTVAPEDGTFYIADMTAKKKITDVACNKGVTVTVAPAEGTISTSNMAPVTWKLDPTHHFEIYFRANPQNIWNQTSKETKEKVTTEQQHPN